MSKVEEKVKGTVETLEKVEQPVAVIDESASKAVAPVDDYSEDAGIGVENISRDELLIPFIRILQPLSPEVNETESKYVEGAKAGALINTATSELFDGKKGVLFIPVSRTHTFGEFVPRNSGGGFKGVWNDDDPRIPALRAAQGQFGKLALDNGNELVETYSFFGLVADAAEGLSDDTFWQQAIIGFSSTQIRAYRMITARLVSLLGTPVKYPLWAFTWHLTTVGQKNAKGSFYGWRAALYGNAPTSALLKPSSASYQQAKSFHAFLQSGKAKPDYSTAGAQESDAEDELPF